MTQSRSLVISSLQEYFHGRVTDAIGNQGLDTTQEAEFYLVNLLETFSKAEQLHGGPSEDSRDEPLALMLQRAVETTTDAAIPVYRRIGDLALYTSGFFSRNLERRTVSRTYYYEIGAGAYETLSSLMSARRARVFAEIYNELGTKFGAFVEVLTEIAEEHAFTASSDTLDLIERWELSNSPRATEKLIAEGTLPIITPGRFADDDPN